MNLSVNSFLLASAAYFVSFIVVTGFIAPLQSLLFPNLSLLASFMFLPHGVRVLAFYFWGWRAFLYLFPASFAMWALDYWVKGLEVHLFGVLWSMLAVYIGVLVVRVHLNEQEGSFSSFSWVHAIIAGAIGSALNSLGLAALNAYALEPVLFMSYFIGDVAGQFSAMILMIYGFKIFDALCKNP